MRTQRGEPAKGHQGYQKQRALNATIDRNFDRFNKKDPNESGRKAAIRRRMTKGGAG